MEGTYIYTAGLTRRSFKQRFREHNREYYAGKYTVFDAQLLQEGKREVVWAGFWFRKNRDPQQIADYERRSKERELNKIRNSLTPTLSQGEREPESGSPSP
jgi:hypothetical protein